MEYPEWHEKYVKGDAVAELAEEKTKNASNDFTQYQKYREILKENAPKGFAEFLDLKYNKKEKWGEVKRLYQDVNWQRKAQEKLVSGSVHSVPFLADKNSVFDNYKEGVLESRRYYGGTGKPRLDIDLTAHYNPAQHPIVPHQHNWLRDENDHENISRGKNGDSALTLAQRIANKDILKKVK